MQKPLEGAVHPPRSTAVDRPRRPGGALAAGVPLAAGGVGAVGALALGLVASLALPLALVAALGAGVLLAGGSHLLLRALRPAPTLLVEAQTGVGEGTREVLERILRATAETRATTAALRGRAPDPAARPALDHVDALLGRLEALTGAESVQSSRPSDGSVTLLEGMATRYLPELVEAIEDTIGFLASFQGAAREDALANLTSIDHQLTVLGESLEGVERDVVAGVSRDLEVHAEFLRRRFADEHLTPIIDI
ncbi:hypothetical protein [Brachybacterium sp. J153]|uniref:hypothetical protein n=1 Tax=Brachybacterium sp. J153 TaxID=3116488 RepID=UPI002E75E71A|nr:hypothetical protein [Brachybacterium sp. J153]MEE1618622.1 hypothetical protein [Brachybacterium sp. J153]